MIRTAWVLFNLFVSTPPLSLITVIASYVGAGDRFFHGMARFWCGWMLRASGVRVTVIGAEHVAQGRPQIIAANHTSWYDVLALSRYTPKRFRFVAKKELARVPLWGRAWQAAGHIAIDRRDTQRSIESLDRAARLVREDRSCIVIFPEGTRSATGELLPFKKGTFMLAVRNGIEVVPTAIQGARGILPKGSWRVRPDRIILRFGPPVPSAEYGEARREELVAHVRSEIERLMQVPPPDRDNEHVYHNQHTRP